MFLAHMFLQKNPRCATLDLTKYVFQVASSCEYGPDKLHPIVHQAMDRPVGFLSHRQAQAPSGVGQSANASKGFVTTRRTFFPQPTTGVDKCSPFLFSELRRIMRKEFVFRARVDDRHQAKIDAMQKATGWTTSELLRALVESAEPQTIVRSTPTKSNSDVNIRQDSHAAAAA